MERAASRAVMSGWMLGDRPYGGSVPGRLRRRPLCRERADTGREGGRVALQDEQGDLVEHGLDLLRIERIAVGADDPLGLRGARARVRVEERLVQLLPRSPPRDLDGDVAV